MDSWHIPEILAPGWKEGRKEGSRAALTIWFLSHKGSNWWMLIQFLLKESFCLVRLKKTSLHIFAGLDEFIIAFSFCNVESRLSSFGLNTQSFNVVVTNVKIWYFVLFRKTSCRLFFDCLKKNWENSTFKCHFESVFKVGNHIIKLRTFVL